MVKVRIIGDNKYTESSKIDHRCIHVNNNWNNPVLTNIQFFTRM